MKFHLSIIVTNQCNLKCSYCYENNNPPCYINVEKAKSEIEHHLNSTTYEEVIIDFFGGEPFMAYSQIKEICEWTWSKQWETKYLFFATTNGVLIHGEIKEWLKANKSRFWVSLSLDGTPESHNINRSNSYYKIDIPFFKECWPLQTVKMTISKETVDKIYDNIVHIHSLGFNITGTNFAEGIDWEDKKYVSIVRIQLEKLCQFYIDNPNIKVPPILNMRLFKCEQPRHTAKWCGTGEYMAALNTDGKVYPCTFLTPMTFDGKDLELINSIDFKNSSLFTDEDCIKNCYLHPVCNNCYGANLLTTGKINKRTRSCCELIKLRAVYTAALQANKILKAPTDTYENSLTVKAIFKINELYNK